LIKLHETPPQKNPVRHSSPACLAHRTRQQVVCMTMNWVAVPANHI
jgi:hypothetical protein